MTILAEFRADASTVPLREAVRAWLKRLGIDPTDISTVRVVKTRAGYHLHVYGKGPPRVVPLQSRSWPVAW